MMKRFIAILLFLLTPAPLLALERNVASQKLYIQEMDSATHAPKTGDATNLTAYVAKDGGALTALGDTSATELSSTNAPGVYWFDLTQAETNAAICEFTAKSSTGGCYILDRSIATTAPNQSLMIVDASGVVKAAPGKTIYVATTGNDSNVGTAASPKLTINGAIAACTDWDRIVVGTGTYAESVDASGLKHLTIEAGTAREGVTISSTSGPAIKLGQYATLTALICNTIDTTASAIKVNDSNGVIINLCRATSLGLYGLDAGTPSSSYGLRCRGSFFTGGKDGGYFGDAEDIDVQNCGFICLGTYSASTDGFFGAQMAAGHGEFRHCQFLGYTNLVTSLPATGCEISSGYFVFRDCQFFGTQDNASSTGLAAGLADKETGAGGAVATVDHCSFTTQQDGSGINAHFRSQSTNSRVQMSDCNIDRTKLSGVGGVDPYVKFIDGDVADTKTRALLAMPAAAPAATGGLPIIGTGAGSLNPSGGRIGPNWADVGAPTTAVALSGTTISGGGGLSLDTTLAGHTTAGTLGGALSLASTAEQSSNFPTDFLAQFAIATSSAPDITPAINAGNRILAMTTSGNVYTAPSLVNAPSGGGGFTVTVDNTEPDPAHTYSLGSRADGMTTTSPPVCILKVGEAGPIWLETTKIAGGKWLTGISNATSSNAGNLAVTNSGINQSKGVIWLNPMVAGSYVVTADLAVGNRTIKAAVNVKVQ